ncbi:hypothetical protein JVU11DRAFT_9368 [Chiua virens]|nr:hypothetical protein JVU11DRAFT_9122 [Chiua virens]KAG9310758.1 hypothetical protein JVU11DRAFT_9368 [Chiua virens]
MSPIIQKVIEKVDEKGMDMSATRNSDAVAIVITNRLREALNREKARMMNPSDLVECLSLDACSHRSLTMEERRPSILLLHSTPFLLPSLSMSACLSLCVFGICRQISGQPMGRDESCANFSPVNDLGLTYHTGAYVEFSHCKVELSDLSPKYFAIVLVKWSFMTLLKVSDGTEERAGIDCLQLPIQPAFAVAGHSAQGEKATVDLSEGRFSTYVAASTRCAYTRGFISDQTHYSARLE